MGVDTAVDVAVPSRMGIEGSAVEGGGTERDRNWDVEGKDLESNWGWFPVVVVVVVVVVVEPAGRV